jgi:hypothetical protein
MMAHFEKLKTPLGAVEKYPTTSAQQRRFQSLGWTNVSAQNLWSLFSSPDFLRPEERKALDQVEPFDEWEEFALFGCHYVLLVANTDYFPGAVADLHEMDTPLKQSSSTLEMEVRFSRSPKGCGCKRFAAGLPLKGPDRASTNIGNFAGMGLQTRVDSMDVYATVSESQQGPQPSNPKTQSSPSGRMCHTTTDLGDSGSLLVGGRTGPDSAFKDCWLYHKCEFSGISLGFPGLEAFCFTSVLFQSKEIMLTSRKGSMSGSALMIYLIHSTDIRRLTLGKAGFLYQRGGSTLMKFLRTGFSGVDNLAGWSVMLMVKSHHARMEQLSSDLIRVVHQIRL